MKKKLLLTFLIFLCSCTFAVKNEPDNDKFERQISDNSTDLMIVGDNLNFWGSDAPSGAIFFLNAKTRYLKAFGVKPVEFKEMDKPREELLTLINTEPIYHLEVYSLEKPEKITTKEPNICDYISENFSKAKLVFKSQGNTFRVKERNWIPLETSIDSNALTFIRLGTGEPFSVISDNAVDAISIYAKKSDKTWQEFNPNDKKQVLSWTCQESVFIENKRFEPMYYNPDIVFQLE